MNLHPASQWQESTIETFLVDTDTPLRLSFLNNQGEPMICSLWFSYHDDILWAASHKNSYVVKQLRDNTKVSFEVSTNNYPYKGVRGKATAELTTTDADQVLTQLINKYLDEGNSNLASWLMSRAKDEYVIKIRPESINAWDFSDRMQHK